MRSIHAHVKHKKEATKINTLSTETCRNSFLAGYIFVAIQYSSILHSHSVLSAIRSFSLTLYLFLYFFLPMACVPFDNKVEGNRHTRRRKKTRFYFITSFVFSNFSLLCVCLLLCSDYVDKYGSSTDTNTFTFNVHDVHVNCNVFHRTTQNGANIR